MSGNNSAAWQAAQDDDTLRTAALERLVSGFHRIEDYINSLPDTISEAQEKQIAQTTKALEESITSIKEAIKGLPEDLDQQTTNMQAFIFEAAQSVDTKVKELEIRVETINSMALKSISQAMLESVNVFEKNLNEAKESVLSDFQEKLSETITNSNLESTVSELKGATQDTLNSVNSNTKERLEEISHNTKKIMSEVKESTKEDTKEIISINRQAAWLIIGATAFINITSLIVNFVLSR